MIRTITYVTVWIYIFYSTDPPDFAWIVGYLFCGKFCPDFLEVRNGIHSLLEWYNHREGATYMIWYWGLFYSSIKEQQSYITLTQQLNHAVFSVYFPVGLISSNNRRIES